MPVKRKSRRAPEEHTLHTFASRFDVVAIGASAGGLHALTEVLRPLSADFPASL